MESFTTADRRQSLGDALGSGWQRDETGWYSGNVAVGYDGAEDEYGITLRTGVKGPHGCSCAQVWAETEWDAVMVARVLKAADNQRG